MIVSDKSAVIGGARTHAHRHPCRAYVKKKKNKSLPRARKEKCQTASARRPNRPRRPHRVRRAYRFELRLGPGSFGFSGCPHAARLTFLTVPCQKCQTLWCQQKLRFCRGPPRHHPTIKQSTQIFM
jgi:hypothetical protein